MYVILDPTANAFATEGQLIFVHSGLIFLLSHQNQLRGVLAHEVGHLLGGHLVRLRQEIERANMMALLSAAIGTLAAVVSGNPEAAIAGIAGGQMSALGSLMKYQQSEENAADQVAVAALHSIGASAQDMQEVMQIFEQQERMHPQGSISYMRTHPFSSDRKSLIARQVSLEKGKKRDPLDPEFTRIQTKLYAFTMPPALTFTRYPDSDYAHAIAHYKAGNTKRSFTLLEKLIKQAPDDIFLSELYGQFLFEAGEGKKAFPYYFKALEARPFDFLIAYGTFLAAVEADDKKDLQKLELYIPTLLKEPSATTYRLYARFYEKLGKKAHMAYGMAEYMAMSRNLDQARAWIAKAKTEKDATEALKLKIQDLDDILNTIKKRSGKKR